MLVDFPSAVVKRDRNQVALAALRGQSLINVIQRNERIVAFEIGHLFRKRFPGDVNLTRASSAHAVVDENDNARPAFPEREPIRQYAEFCNAKQNAQFGPTSGTQDKRRVVALSAGPIFFEWAAA